MWLQYISVKIIHCTRKSNSDKKFTLKYFWTIAQLSNIVIDNYFSAVDRAGLALSGLGNAILGSLVKVQALEYQIQVYCSFLRSNKK